MGLGNTEPKFFCVDIGYFYHKLLWYAVPNMSFVKYPYGNVLLRNLKKNYPVISHGEGIYLWDTNGKKYIDASGGAMVTSVGSGNREVADAINAQMQKVAYVNGMHFTSQVVEDFAKKLSSLAPEGLKRVVVLGSGSEAIEAAVKFARQLWVERGKSSKGKFIARSPGDRKSVV